MAPRRRRDVTAHGSGHGHASLCPNVPAALVPVTEFLKPLEFLSAKSVFVMLIRWQLGIEDGARETNVGQIMKGQYMVFTFYTESNEELKDIKLGSDL